MKIKNEKELFELVCDTATATAKYHKPFLNNEDGNVWATDGRILLIIKPERLEQKYAEDSLKVTAYAWESTPKVVRLEALEKALQKCPKVEITTNEICKECGGIGYVRWIYQGADYTQYEENFECPVCHADYIERGTGKFHTDPHSIIKLGEAYFLAEYIEKLKRCMQFLDQEKAVLTTNSQLGVTTFELENALIKLMPHLYRSETDEPIGAGIELKEA